MTYNLQRRDFVKQLGLGALSLPFLSGLPSLGFAGASAKKQRLVVIFSPNGVVPDQFWPEEEGENFTLKPILQPLAPYKDKMLLLHGVSDKIGGDGDSHMRGIGCLLTGTELFPGNIQGGSHTPAGWASGLSIDQEIKNALQSNPETRTRFGSLEFGVVVPERADTWTRMVYAGANKPIAPIDDPYKMLSKLYGQLKDRESLKSILDPLQADLAKIRSMVSVEDRQLLEEQTTFVREMEKELKQENPAAVGHAVPQLELGVRDTNENMPKISKMQIELMVNSFKSDFARIASLQYTNSVGQAKMSWLGIDEGHHSLSHEPDSNTDAMDKLTKINTWYAEQVAYLCKKLAETPEPGDNGSMLDHTMVIWTNELGKGSSHTLNDIPFVMIGGGMGYKMGRSLKLGRVAHNRLHLALAHSFGHNLKTFGNPDYCGEGALSLS
ncbi:DUF1552 domain-containing protein [Rubinisphaera margarita]|uniref:DUF1552 domain-containing protein n=1 Tax=Rubinisphaera margarita TaxID=2909586 RepID=UPI001EE82B57|nr:DUF1552 domain-containing protein [Rubinisphaera margarita]MCG6155777.1 DUF1552 domain-containing protein [Rubinisphaera margarita]